MKLDIRAKIDLAVTYMEDGARLTAADRLEEAAAALRARHDELYAYAGLAARAPTSAELCEAAVRKASEMCSYAMGKFDWGKSALDAKAIGQLNEGMLAVENAMRALNKRDEGMGG